MSQRICYFDCFSGASGDMLLSSLIDAGARLEDVRSALSTITEIQGEWELSASRVMRSAGMISANHIKVDSIHHHKPLPPPSDPTAPSEPSRDHDHGCDHDHDDVIEADQSHDHSHSHSHGHDHGHDHGHEYGHSDRNTVHTVHAVHEDEVRREHEHNHDLTHTKTANTQNAHGHEHGHTHSDAERGLSTIVRYILHSDLSRGVKITSINAFTELALAEATVHGTSPLRVHFHEVGAIDSIIDTVGVVIALELLNIQQVYCSALPMSSGTVWAAHGHMPVPAPATLFLLKGMVLTPGPKGCKGELVTPTGAALLRALCNVNIPAVPSAIIAASSDVEFIRLVNEAVRTRLTMVTPSCTEPKRSTQGMLPPDGFVISAIGTGSGTKDFPGHANILRSMIGTIHRSTNQTYQPSTVSTSSSSRTRFDLRPSAKTTHTVEGSESLTQPIHLIHPTNNELTVELIDEDEAKNSILTAEGSRSSWVIDNTLCLLECNIDDMTPEALAYLQERLMGLGAADAWLEHISMKKGRQAMKLAVLCAEESKDPFLRAIFQESASIGVRIRQVSRACLAREMMTLALPVYNTSVLAKASYLDNKIVTCKPEFEDCKELSLRLNVPLKLIMSEVATVVAEVMRR